MPLLFITRNIWRYRHEIILAVQVLAALRKTAKEAAEDYIRRRVKEQLFQQIRIVSVEVGLLVGAGILMGAIPSLTTRLVGSFVLWGITLYNLLHLFLVTIPELKGVYRALKGKTGFALRYVLKVSIVTELMELELVFLGVCIVLGISTRGAISSGFSYVEPWREIFHSLATFAN